MFNTSLIFIELSFEIYLVNNINRTPNKKDIRIYVRKMSFFLDNLSFVYRFAIKLYLTINYAINFILKWMGFHSRLVEFPRRLYFGYITLLRAIIFDSGINQIA
jgi:hypothetical protein